MMPNIDPRTLRNMMAKMGIKSTELQATSVTIECPDRQIVIENPQVTQIEAQGALSFQIAGDVSEKPKEELDSKPEVTDEDIELVSSKTGISDRDRVREALEHNNGDIAATILELTGSAE